ASRGVRGSARPRGMKSLSESWNAPLKEPFAKQYAHDDQTARARGRLERIASMAVMESAGGTADDTIRRTLKLVFGLVPIVAGLDKFTDLLVQWDKYLAPPIAHLLPMTPRF